MCNKGVLRCWFISPEGAFLLAVLLSVNKLAQKNRPQTSCTDLGLFYTDFDFEAQQKSYIRNCYRSSPSRLNQSILYTYGQAQHPVFPRIVLIFYSYMNLYYFKK